MAASDVVFRAGAREPVRYPILPDVMDDSLRNLLAVLAPLAAVLLLAAIRGHLPPGPLQKWFWPFVLLSTAGFSAALLVGMIGMASFAAAAVLLILVLYGSAVWQTLVRAGSYVFRSSIGLVAALPLPVFLGLAGLDPAAAAIVALIVHFLAVMDPLRLRRPRRENRRVSGPRSGGKIREKIAVRGALFRVLGAVGAFRFRRRTASAPSRTDMRGEPAQLDAHREPALLSGFPPVRVREKGEASTGEKPWVPTIGGEPRHALRE